MIRRVTVQLALKRTELTLKLIKAAIQAPNHLLHLIPQTANFHQLEGFSDVF